MDDQVVEILKEIRDEAKQTNVRLDQTNTRLASVEERLEFLGRRQTESEIHLVTEIISLADVTRQVRDLLIKRHDDHVAVLDHETRIRSLESRIGDHSHD
jgi:hypothetical protein